MCSSIILSGHIEGKGQGGDLTGWGNPFSLCTNSPPAQAISSKAIKQCLFFMLDTYHRPPSDAETSPPRSAPAATGAEWDWSSGWGLYGAELTRLLVYGLLGFYIQHISMQKLHSTVTVNQHTHGSRASSKWNAAINTPVSVYCLSLTVCLNSKHSFARSPRARCYTSFNCRHRLRNIISKC